MLDDMSVLMWGLLFGTIGLGFFSYGRKQRAIVPLVSGICLFIVPYVFTNVYLLVASGIGLMVLPYYVKI